MRALCALCALCACVWHGGARSGRCACARVSRGPNNAEQNARTTTDDVPQGSTPFLHACSILYKLRLAHTRAYKACGCALLALFFATRVVAAPLCVASLWHHRGLWDAAGQAALLRAQLAVCAAFVALNFVWFAKLCRRALGLGGRRKKASAAAKDAAPHRLQERGEGERACDDASSNGGAPLAVGDEKWE